MRTFRLPVVFYAILIVGFVQLAVARAADDFQPEPGFEMLFNGKDLTGWSSRPTSEQDLASRDRWKKADPNAPPWPVITEAIAFDGKTESDSGRYVAKDGALVVTEPKEG